jgi:hypothetical protein
MHTDATTYIGLQAKHIMEVIADIDPYFPDEDLVEVLIGMVSTWGSLESQLLFPTLEAALEGAEEFTDPARKRLRTLQTLQGTLHDELEPDSPYADTAKKYIDAVKFHLLVDVQDIAPLAAQLEPHISLELAAAMSALKAERE